MHSKLIKVNTDDTGRQEMDCSLCCKLNVDAAVAKDHTFCGVGLPLETMKVAWLVQMVKQWMVASQFLQQNFWPSQKVSASALTVACCLKSSRVIVSKLCLTSTMFRPSIPRLLLRNKQIKQLARKHNPQQQMVVTFII